MSAPGTKLICKPMRGGFRGRVAHFGVTASALGAVMMALPAVTRGGPTGETCFDAIFMVEGTANDQTINRDDDGNTGLPECEDGDDSYDAYYTFTATRDGVWTVSTCGLVTNFDTVISIHSDCPAADFPLHCNDDDSGCGTSSRVEFEALTGQSFIIRVGGYLGDFGDFALTVSGPPVPPCDCETATEIAGNTFVDGTTTEACPAPCYGDGIATLFAWTPDLNGQALVNAAGVGFNPVVAVFSTCPPSGENEIACSDFGQVQFCASAGTTYYIRVGAIDLAGGPFELLAIVFATSVYEGPIQNPANGHWYYLTRDGQWDATEAFAASLGGHLVTIDDAAENEWVRANLANYAGQTYNVWIGLSDAAVDGTFTWASGAPLSYTQWGAGEPSTFPSEDYVIMDFSNGDWLARENCGVTFVGVVEVDQVNTPELMAGPIRNPANCHDYYLTQPGTWTETQLRAELLGGHLVTINDASENEWVRSTFANHNGQRTVWIGLEDRAMENVFTWQNGEPVTYTNWNPGEPNNLGNEDFVAMNEPATGGWNDAHGGELASGVIELPAGHCPCQCPGDANCSGAVDFFDIDPFLLALFDLPTYGATYCGGSIATADVNASGAVDFFDIDPFLVCLFGGCP